MTTRDPNIIHSGLSRAITQDGVTIDIKIYRVEDVPGWALEVVNSEGTSTVWDDLFDTDDEADAAFRQTLADEGVTAFLDSATVIPFKRRP